MGSDYVYKSINTPFTILGGRERHFCYTVILRKPPNYALTFCRSKVDPGMHNIIIKSILEILKSL